MQTKSARFAKPLVAPFFDKRDKRIGVALKFLKRDFVASELHSRNQEAILGFKNVLA